MKITVTINRLTHTIEDVENGRDLGGFRTRSYSEDVRALADHLDLICRAHFPDTMSNHEIRLSRSTTRTVAPAHLYTGTPTQNTVHSSINEMFGTSSSSDAELTPAYNVSQDYTAQPQPTQGEDVNAVRY